MKAWMYMHGDKVYASKDDLESQCCELSNEDILAATGTKKTNVVLRDPAIVSDSSETLLSNKNDCHKMASAKFRQLAGINGFGSWAVVQHLGKRRLFSWAIDSGAQESRRLQSMVDSGIQLNGISSEILVHPLPIEAVKVAVFFRVICTESSTQLALMLHGNWIFLRRVDTLSIASMEAVKSTLVHLKVQFYLDDTKATAWQLIASESLVRELSPLWEGEDVLLSAPLQSSVLCHSSSDLDCANCVGENSDSHLLRYLSMAKAAISVLILLTLSYLMPPALLAVNSLNSVSERAQEIDPESVSMRYWQMALLQSQPMHSMKSVSTRFRKVIEMAAQESALELVSVSMDVKKSLTLRIKMASESTDPLYRLRWENRLTLRLKELLPNYRLSDFKGGSLAVGGRQEKPTYEITLEVNHDKG